MHMYSFACVTKRLLELLEPQTPAHLMHWVKLGTFAKPRTSGSMLMLPTQVRLRIICCRATHKFLK